MPVGRPARFATSLAAMLVALVVLRPPAPMVAAAPVPSPEQFIGFRVGTDNRLARWDRIVDYFKEIAEKSDRVRYRELGKTNHGNPFVLL